MGDDIVRSDSRTSFSKDESVETILENAENYQQELQNCGQPTVLTPSTSTSFHPKCKKKGFEKEVIFASWRSNLAIPDDYSQACNSDFYFFKNDSYQAENYFASWKRNLNHFWKVGFIILRAQWMQKWISKNQRC